MSFNPYIHKEIEKNGRKYVFSMPAGSPLGEAYDAGFEYLQGILELAQKATANAKPVEKE